MSIAKKKHTKRYPPFAREANADAGNNAFNMFPILIAEISAASSIPVGGIRGSFTIPTETSPSKVRRKDVTMMIANVQRAVFPTILEILSLLTETIAVQKTKGTTR